MTVKPFKANGCSGFRVRGTVTELRLLQRCLEAAIGNVSSAQLESMTGRRGRPQLVVRVEYPKPRAEAADYGDGVALRIARDPARNGDDKPKE